MSTDHNFLRERRAEADSNRGPSAYQPNALPLGQTGSPERVPRLRQLNWTVKPRLHVPTAGWVLLYVHRNHRLIRDRSPGCHAASELWTPRLKHDHVFVLCVQHDQWLNQSAGSADNAVVPAPARASHQSVLPTHSEPVRGASSWCLAQWVVFSFCLLEVEV